jgi:hypothetical protein
LGSAESPTADFLLDWLKSSRSDPRRYVASLSCRPQVETQLKPPCIYGRSLFCTVPAACTGSTCQNIRGSQNYWRSRHTFNNFCENSKILSRLLSVLSLSRKFVYDHYCCPKSAVILTASKLEAILDFWRGYRKTVPNVMEREGGGLSLGPLILITWPPAVRQTRNVGKVGGGGGEKGERRNVLLQITAHSNSCPSFSLSFCPLCIRRGFNKIFAHDSAKQL